MAENAVDNIEEELDLGTTISGNQTIKQQPQSHTDLDVLDQAVNISKETLIPWEPCCLPSDGLYYDWPDGTVAVRPMGLNAEKAFTNRRLLQSGQAINHMFEECVQLQGGLTPGQLLVGDRTFLLYYVRAATFGNEYEFYATCPQPDCKAKSKYIYDLNQLASTITGARKELGPEPFELILPKISSILGVDFKIKIRLLRVDDIVDINQSRKAHTRVAQPAMARTRSRQRDTKEVPIDPSDQIDQNLEKVIVEMMGSRDRNKISDVVSKLQSGDISTIREYLNEITPGIDTTIELGCPECEATFVIELPITDGFFRKAE